MTQQNQTPPMPPVIINAGFESPNPLEGWKTDGKIRYCSIMITMLYQRRACSINRKK